VAKTGEYCHGYVLQRNHWTVGMADENPWVWWLLLSFGMHGCFSFRRLD